MWSKEYLEYIQKVADAVKAKTASDCMPTCEVPIHRAIDAVYSVLAPYVVKHEEAKLKPMNEEEFYKHGGIKLIHKVADTELLSSSNIADQIELYSVVAYLDLTEYIEQK